MKITSRMLLIIAIALIVYGYWGAFTQSGNKVYDEMDAYYPFFAMILGIILFTAYVILIIIMRRRKGK